MTARELIAIFDVYSAAYWHYQDVLKVNPYYSRAVWVAREALKDAKVAADDARNTYDAGHVAYIAN